MKILKLILVSIIALMCVCVLLQFPITYILKENDVAWAQTYWDKLNSNERWIKFHF